MRRKQLSWRLISAFLAAGLVYSGLAPTPAIAAGGLNLAAGRPASASGSNGPYTAGSVNDGNPSTYWESPNNAFPQWVQIDLGGSASVDQVVLKLPGFWETRTQTLSVQGSTSGTSFSTLSASGGRIFNPASGNTVTIDFTAATARYVRVHVTANTGWPAAQVSEFEIYGAGGGDPSGGTNLAAGKPIEESSHVHTYVAANANDGNLGTYWESAGFPATLTVKLGANADISSVTVKLNPDPVWGPRTQTFEILGRDQGATAYTPLKATATYSFSPSGNQNSVTIPVTGRTADVRLRFTANAGAPGGQVAEVEVVGTMAPNPEPGPDLRVTSITSNPPNPAVGAVVTFTVAVNNRGTTATGATTVTRVVVGGTTLNTSTASIAAGATVNVAISGSWTATSGGATITATADATGAVTETNEGNNSLTRSIVVGRGAAVPYVEYEAEAADYRGQLLVADPLRTFGHTNFATESSGRQSVRLNSTGQYVEITSTSPANSIVVRNSIPDAPNGGGIEATISLYVNGTFSRKLTLSSRNSWLYGTTDDTEGLSNNPQANARRLFDESHALLSQTYPEGTRFRLQRDASDGAQFYIIDLIDLEQVAPPLTQPAGCTSITQYGAVAGDGLDDSAAIQRAVTDDENGVISCVWIPAGQWRQEQKILSPDPTRGLYNQKGIRDVTIRGAGMWHTQLYTLTEPQNVVGNINHPHEGNVGFDIDHNTQVSDLAIFGMTTNRANRGHGINGRLGKNTRISNVWIEHVNVGAWVGRDYSDTPAYWNPGDGVEFTGMRIRNTYADGINFANSTRNSRVFNSSFRTTGDDSLAVWSSTFVRDQATDIGHDNHFTNNTIQLPWRANGIAIYGGYGNTVENNLIYDTMNYPGIMLATDHSPQPFSGQTLIANNGLHRCGGVFWGEQQKFGAITLFAPGRDIPGVVIRDTDIVDSTYDGIQFKTGGGNMPGVVITNVRIDRSNNGAGILAQGGARGSATLTNVTITNSAAGNIVIEPGSPFQITGG